MHINRIMVIGLLLVLLLVPFAAAVAPADRAAKLTTTGPP